MNMKRQGDLLFVRVDGPGPERGAGTYVIAHGEATGHCHEIAVEDRTSCAVLGPPAAPSHLTVREPVRVVHPEHRTVVLDPGLWEVRRQREHTPEGQLLVAD